MDGNRECEVDCGQFVAGQTLDKLVRSLLHLEDPHGNCAVCLGGTVHGHVGDHKLQPAGRIGLHYTQAGYKFGFGGAVRHVSYLRNICKSRCKKKKKKHVSFLCFPRLAVIRYLHITLRSDLSSCCCPPLYLMLHRNNLLWSSLEGWKLRVDVVLCCPWLSCVCWISSRPRWLQVKTGGDVGQEWVTEQDTEAVLPTLILPLTDKDMGPPLSATSRKPFRESEVLMADVNVSLIRRLRTCRFLIWRLCSWGKKNCLVGQSLSWKKRGPGHCPSGDRSEANSSSAWDSPAALFDCRM